MTAAERVRMPESGGRVHPYIPNSAPDVRRAMLDYLGVADVADLYAAIPTELRLDRALDLPEAILSEHNLKAHVLGLLGDVVSTEDYASFLGGGCWKHLRPGRLRRDQQPSRVRNRLCRGGLLGSRQASGLVRVAEPPRRAAGGGLRITADLRLDGRGVERPVDGGPPHRTGEVIVPRNLNPERLSHMRNYCRAGVDAIHTVDFDPATGEMDVDGLDEKLSASTAAVYFENPTFLGTIEGRAPEIAAAARRAGAMCVVGVDPISLGSSRRRPHTVPTSWSAMSSRSGFTCRPVAPPVGLSPATTTRGSSPSTRPCWRPSPPPTGKEYGVSDGPPASAPPSTRGACRRTSPGPPVVSGHHRRRVPLAPGPTGIREVGETIMQKAHYTKARLDALPGIGVGPTATPFKEFVVDFTGTGRTVAEINRSLLEYRILGGQDLSAGFPELGRTALYCVTEVTPLEHIDRLVSALGEVAS